VISHRGEDGFSVFLRNGVLSRFSPWDTLDFQHRLSPVEFSAAFKLKLDMFAHVMDWLFLTRIIGVGKDSFLATLREAIDVVVKRDELVGPVGVVITHLSLRIIQEIKAQFVARAEKEIMANVQEYDSFSNGLATDLRNAKNRQRAHNEYAHCLLAWLWIMEGIPERFLGGGDAEVKVEDVKKVFRGNGDNAGVPARAVVLVSG
jgi:hypothetical protein